MVSRASGSSMESQSSLPLIPPTSSPNDVVAFNHTISVKLDYSNFLLWRQQILSVVRGYALESFLDS
ncbi:hypothetical protein QN277_021213 [Acacia crassicarpa]|uniref:Retrotransposon Copia-like N-terminal domain-containing protein n=1 Tax=Acacia crassicarpa TaxID=499986 RepID=A0AAE1MQA7_9FABA|nr:hypothetical protein QN277_021213 [Acacia crassicarpa]